MKDEKVVYILQSTVYGIKFIMEAAKNDEDLKKLLFQQRANCDAFHQEIEEHDSQRFTPVLNNKKKYMLHSHGGKELYKWKDDKILAWW